MTSSLFLKTPQIRHINQVAVPDGGFYVHAEPWIFFVFQYLEILRRHEALCQQEQLFMLAVLHHVQHYETMAGRTALYKNVSGLQAVGIIHLIKSFFKRGRTG